MTHRRLARAGVVGPVLGLVLAGATPAAAVDRSDRLDATVTVLTGGGAEIPLVEVDENRPLRLDPDRELELELEVTNPGDRAVVVRTVRLQGQVLGMTFFDYATRVDLRVGPGATEELSLPLDVSELGEQATGLLPASLTLTGEDRDVLVDEPFPVEVEGSLWSTYGVFGLLVAAVTLVLLGAALVRLAVGALPRHRWLRASRFAVPGLGLGLTLTFTLSVLGVLVPSADSWVAIVVAGGLLGLLAGFFTPSPDGDRRQDRAVPPASEDAAALDELTTYQTDHVGALQDEQDGDRVIVLPDDGRRAGTASSNDPDVPVRDDAHSVGAAETISVPPTPRLPDDGDAGGATGAALPPRPPRRR